MFLITLVVFLYLLTNIRESYVGPCILACSCCRFYQAKRYQSTDKKKPFTKYRSLLKFTEENSSKRWFYSNRKHRITLRNILLQRIGGRGLSLSKAYYFTPPSPITQLNPSEYTSLTPLLFERAQLCFFLIQTKLGTLFFPMR